MPTVKNSKADVAIIMGSATDWPALKTAAAILKKFGISYHVEVVSAHRTPDAMVKFAKSAHQRFKVIIAGAGGAAHLPGMVASLTILPVIGVPVLVGKLQGVDALLSIAQMPRGVPVATVGIDNGDNAGILATRILGIENLKIKRKLERFTASQKLKVKKANAKLKSRRKK